MHRATKLLIFVSLLVCCGTRIAAADIDEMLNAPAWVLTWEVSFKATGQRPETTLAGVSTHTDSVDTWFSSTLLLNFRNGGPNLSMVKLSMSAPKGADQQKQILDLVMKTDVMANWMYTPPGSIEEDLPEPGKDPLRDSATAVSGTAMARINAVEVTTGTNLTTEMGSHYNLHRRVIRKGSAKVTVPTQMVFEMDSKSKHYLITLSYEYEDPDYNQGQIENHEHIEYNNDPPTDSVTTGVISLKYPESIEVDPSKLMGEVLLLEGQIDPGASVVTGDATIPAYYIEMGDQKISGTLHVRYTLKPR